MQPKRTRQPKAAPVAVSLTAEEKSANLRVAASKAREGEIKPVKFAPPALAPGVVPKGKTAAIAMDEAMPAYAYLNSYGRGEFSPFPGYPYLANLSTRAEYRQMVETLATELTREWIKLKSKADDNGEETADPGRIAELENAINEFGLQAIIKKVAADDGYFGRGQIAIKIKGADDSIPLVLSPKTVKQGSLEGFATVEALWTTPLAYNAIDPTAPDFYKPRAWYMLGKEIHASRLLTIISRPLPDMLKPAYNFGGMSLSQLAEPTVENWLRTRQSVSDLINNFSITAIKTNMAQVLQGQCDGSDLFSRLDLFTQTRSNRGVMALDMDAEELVQVNTPLSGLDALQAQALEHMCVVSRQPAVILTGVSPSGLNASSEGEIRVFYDWISAAQNSVYRDPLSIMIKLIMLHLWGEIDDTIDFEFNPLWQLSAKEEAELRRADADTAAIYVDRSVLSPEEVRQNLASNQNSGYSNIDVQDLPEVPEADPLDGLDPDDAFVAQDADRWITVKPNGPDAKGRPALIGEGGEIKSGMGGKFNGQKIDNLKGENEKPKEMSTHEAAQAAGVKGVREGMKHEALERKVRAHLAGQRGAALIAAGKNTDLPQYKGVTEEAAKGLAEVVSEYQYSVNTSNWELDARGMKGIEKLVAGGVIKPGNDRYIHEMTQAGKEIAQKILRNPVSKVSIEDALKEISKS